MTLQLFLGSMGLPVYNPDHPRILSHILPGEAEAIERTSNYHFVTTIGPWTVGAPYYPGDNLAGTEASVSYNSSDGSGSGGSAKLGIRNNSAGPNQDVNIYIYQTFTSPEGVYSGRFKWARRHDQGTADNNTQRGYKISTIAADSSGTPVSTAFLVLNTSSETWTGQTSSYSEPVKINPNTTYYLTAWVSNLFLDNNM